MRRILRVLLLAGSAVTASLGIAAASEDPLYTSLGGREGIVAIVDQATANFLADGRIKNSFDNANIDQFKGLLTDQLCAVSGGPCVYKGRDMHVAHKGLHLTNYDFNALVEDLQDAMDSCQLPLGVQSRLLARLAPMQRQTVTK